MPWPERVQCVKQESAALGGDDADSGPDVQYPINPFEDVIEAAGYELQEPDGSTRDATVLISRDTGEMTFKDTANPAPVTLSDLLVGSGGLTPTSHRALDQLVHGVAENSYDQYIYTGSRVDAVITWETAGMLKKIREETYTYTGSRVTTIVTKQYDAAGVLLTGETMTEVFSYTGSRVDDTARTVA